MSASSELEMNGETASAMSVSNDEDEVQSLSDMEMGKLNAPLESCLLCGSRDDRSFEMESANRVKWTLHFCQLFRIDECPLVAQTTKAEMWTTMQGALYCSDCMDSLERISHLLQTIEDINAQLRVIQLQCEAKLRAAKQNLHDPHEVKRRRSLWTCMRVGAANGADRDLRVTGMELPLTSVPGVNEKDDWRVRKARERAECGSNSPASLFSLPDTGSDSELDSVKPEPLDSCGSSPMPILPIQVIQEQSDVVIKLEPADAPRGCESLDEEAETEERARGQRSYAAYELSKTFKSKGKNQNLARKRRRIRRIDSDSGPGSGSEMEQVKKKEKTKRRVKSQVEVNPRIAVELNKPQKGWEGRLACPFALECDKRFNTESKRDEHVVLIHEGKKFTCETCGQSYGRQKLLEEHYNVHKGLMPYKCDECPQEFAMSHHRRIHKLNVHIGRPLKCTPCGKSFKNEVNFQRHLRSAHHQRRSKKFACEICGESYELKSQLDEHRNTHSGLTSFKCTECPQEFAKSLQLRIHKLKLHNNRPFKCRPCGKSFIAEANFQKHLSSAFHQTRSKPRVSSTNSGKAPRVFVPRMKSGVYTCHIPDCDKTYTNRGSFRKHLRTHEEATRGSLTCKFCQRTLKSKNSLRQHEALQHTGEAKFRCEHCPFLAMNNHSLQKHMGTVHSEERPLQCDVCGHTFKHPSYLRQHKQTYHPTTKDHMCSVCGKCFSNKRYLKDHDRIHKEVKSFLCTQCGRGFAQKPSLNRHLKTVHKIPTACTATATTTLPIRSSEIPSEHEANEQVQAYAAQNQFPPEMLSLFTPSFPPF